MLRRHEPCQCYPKHPMDIRTGAGYPASALSNLAPHPFVLEGVQCSSMEGLLQSLKFDKCEVQAHICGLAGRAAKLRGQSRNSIWRRKQILWWRGAAMTRDGPEYQAFLDRAYQALCDQNESFRKALLNTGDAVLTHSLGESRTASTVLTRSEFCSRLMRLRHQLTRSQKKRTLG